MTIKAGDRLLIDTNVLMSATDTSRDEHADALRLIGEAGPQGIHLIASRQVLREYLVVATRPLEQNGLGLSSRFALDNVARISRHIALVEETKEVTGALQRLVDKHSLSGKRIHDANLVATMEIHGIGTLITENPRDFKAFDAIQIVDTAQAAAALTG